VICSDPALDSSASANQIHDSYNDGQYQKNVDQASCNVKSPAKKPKNNENSKDGPKHGGTPAAERIPCSMNQKQVLWIQVVCAVCKRLTKCALRLDTTLPDPAGRAKPVC
jgi:hypothetical protein